MIGLHTHFPDETPKGKTMTMEPVAIRARLLDRMLDTDLPPAVALEQARQMWDFVSGARVAENALRSGLDDEDHDLIGRAIGITIDGDGQWLRIDEEGNPVSRDQVDFHPVYAGIRTCTIGGHAAVEIPRFYYARGSLMVSAVQREGFDLHPAFRRRDGSVADCIRVGAYAAGQQDGRAAVAAGLMPWTSISFDAAEERCRELGEGWRMWSIFELAAIKMLAAIEMGGLDMQELIAKGNVDGGTVMGGGESGASWRGIHELWGNVWQMVDGLRLTGEGTIKVWQEGLPGRWIDTGVEYGPGEDDGYPASFHDESGSGFDLAPLFLPSKVTGNRADAIVPDWAWGHWGERETIALCGGNWSHGAGAGVFALDLSVARSSTYTLIGFRPAFAI